MAVDTDIGANSPPAANEPCDRTPDKSKLFLPLFIRFERRIYSYIFTLVPQRADADDLLQETSLVLWDKFDVASPPNDFLAWPTDCLSQSARFLQEIPSFPSPAQPDLSRTDFRVGH